MFKWMVMVMACPWQMTMTIVCGGVGESDGYSVWEDWCNSVFYASGAGRQLLLT